jgi:hypothetical protein
MLILNVGECMNYFILAQLLGIFSFIFGGFSMYTNKKTSVIKYNTISNIASSIQYLFLGAYSAALSLGVILTRNIIFGRYKTNKIPVIYLIFIIIFAIMTSLISYDGPISILPCLSVVIFSYSIWQHNIKKIKIINIVVSIIGIVYDLYYMAYATAFAQVIYIVIGLFSYQSYLKLSKEKTV